MDNTYQYPTSYEFDELLNSCGSMTEQLKQLHYNFNVELLEQSINDNIFYRNVILKLNNTPVILAQSYCKIDDKLFYNILQNAHNQPIGYYLFKHNSKIIRNNLEISLINLINIIELSSQNILKFIMNKYPNTQQLWQRISQFNYENQELVVQEIILPEITIFFK